MEFQGVSNTFQLNFNGFSDGFHVWSLLRRGGRYWGRAPGGHRSAHEAGPRFQGFKWGKNMFRSPMSRRIPIGRLSKFTSRSPFRMPLQALLDALSGASLCEDPQVRVVEEGVKLPPPDWDSDLKNGGRKWEKEALGGAALFVRLVEAHQPIGSLCIVLLLQLYI